MSIFRLVTAIVGVGLIQGCAYVASGWETTPNGQPAVTSRENTIFRNIIYFKNTSPYCTAKVFAGLVKQPVHAKKHFNPVKQSFVLKMGGGEHFVEYNFNTNNFYRTKVEWYGQHKEYLNTEYIGHATSADTYKYLVDKAHMGELRVNLSNQTRKECWKQKNNSVNINIYQ